MTRSSLRRSVRVQKVDVHKEQTTAQQEQDDQDEANLNREQLLQWLVLNMRAEELEKHAEENKIQYYTKKLAELKKKRKHSTELQNILKDIDEKHEKDLRLLDIAKQRDLEQIETSYNEGCDELRENYRIAQMNLRTGWKKLYPGGKRRRVYPESIEELLDRCDPLGKSSNESESQNQYNDEPNLIQELIDRVDSSNNETEKDRRNRLYRVLTKRNENEIKDNIAQLYYDPNDTPQPTQSPFAGSSSSSPKPSNSSPSI